jgi:DNA-binding transcriptional MerR regulator
MPTSTADGGRAYRVREFAALAGVTIRTLHHYDRVGLLKPRRTRASYRVYRDSDLRRLHQILVLKFVGMSLKDIADALENTSKLEDLLKASRWTVKRKHARLNAILLLLEQMQETPAARRDWADLASFVADVGGHTILDGSPRQELDAALQLLGERRLALKVTQEEYELNRDIRAAIARGDAPDSPAGQALVARWRDAITRFEGGDPKLRDALVLVMDAQSRRGDPAYRAYFDRALKAS